MLHGQHDRFYQFFNLFLQTTNIGICFSGTLVDLHCLYPRVEFRREFVQYEIRVLVDTDEVRRLELFRRNETDEWEEDRLSGGCLYDGTFTLTHRVEVLVGAVLFRIWVDIQDLGGQ